MASQYTLADILTLSNPNLLADALKKVNLGVMLAPTVTTISQASSVNVTLDPPALCPGVVSARVTGGASAANVYIVTDAVVSYIPRSETPLSDPFADFV